MAMKLFNDRNFPVAALLVAIILLSVLMTYSIATRQNPEGFSIVYFVPGSLESGSPRYVIENHEGFSEEYRTVIALGGKNATRISTVLGDGENRTFAVGEIQGNWNSTLEITVLRQGKKPLSIYASPS